MPTVPCVGIDCPVDQETTASTPMSSTKALPTVPCVGLLCPTTTAITDDPTSEETSSTTEQVTTGDQTLSTQMTSNITFPTVPCVGPLCSSTTAITDDPVTPDEETTTNESTISVTSSSYTDPNTSLSSESTTYSTGETFSILGQNQEWNLDILSKFSFICASVSILYFNI